MADTKQFNPLPLLSVKTGLDSSLSQIGTDLERYFEAGWAGSEHLQSAYDELHRAVGVLQMLSLEGLAVFSRELETVLKEMLEQQQVPTKMYQDTLRGAMLALTQYLDALADGASNTALRLFYSYQELHQLRGLESAFEVDLFFPEFGVELPSEVLDVPLMPATLASVKKARAQYQRSLLKWLRQDNPEQSLRTMREMVQIVMACAPQDQHRAFWWIATGLLDCLIHDGLPAELNANKLLARIDLQMKSMVENTQREGEYNTTCNMQYLLARSHPVSDTVDKIKQTYELDAYLPESQPLSFGEAAVILEQMQEPLNEAQELLESCENGDEDCVKQLSDKLDQIYVLSEQLDRDTLQFLAKQLHSAISHPDHQNAVHDLKMEMAMGMMLLSKGIEQYQHLGEPFHEQVKQVSHYLQSGISIETTEDKNNLAHLTALHCQMESQEILLPLATEMNSNLQQIELSLGVFFNDHSKRDDLSPLRRLLTQVHGGLYMLSLEEAKSLIGPVQQALERYINNDDPSALEMQAIASAVSALENYVHDLSRGQRPGTKLLVDALKNLDALSVEAKNKIEVAETIMPTGVAVREGGEDAELLEVFLEEAHEVLETLHGQLKICQENTSNREAMIVIRRGFHTLKGSGRMVGLTNLGEVAWSLEKALNKWLQDEKPAVPAVLEMIGDAEVLFHHWVDKLRSGDSALIDATALVAAAERIESGVFEVEEVVKEEEPEPEEIADIVIGDVSLSPILFNIATDEAAGIIDTLHSLFAQLGQDKTKIGHEFVRAAHTLAGISRSTGFTTIAELATAFEIWLQGLMSEEATLSSEHLDLLEKTISALAIMVNAIQNKNQPEGRPELVDALHKGIAQQEKPRQQAVSEAAVQESHIADADEEVIELVSYAEHLEQVNKDSQEQTKEAQSIDEMDLSAELQIGDTQQEKPRQQAVPEAAIQDIHIADADEEVIELVSYAEHLEQINKDSQGQTKEAQSIDEMDLSAELQIGDTQQEKPRQQAVPEAAVQESHIAEADEEVVELVSYAEHLEQVNKNSQEQNEEEQPIDDEVDLVAFVQRVAQEQASEPLQWKSPDEVHNDVQTTNDLDLNASGTNSFNLDMDQLQSEVVSEIQSKKSVNELKIPDDFSFNFDELTSVPKVQQENKDVAALSSLHESLAALKNEPASKIQIDSLSNEKDQERVNKEILAKPEAVSSKAQGTNKDEGETEEYSSETKKRVIQDDLDDQLLPIFLEEADEIYPQLSSELIKWRQASGKPEEGLKIARQLQRSLHTLKGSARMAGAMRLGELTHRVEDCLDSAVAAGRQDVALFDELDGFFDRIGNALEKLRKGDVSEDKEIKAPSAVSVSVNVVPTPAEQSVDVAEDRRESAVLRIRSDIVDDLVNEAGEISVARSRMETELSAFKGGLQDLTGSVQGLRKLLREIEMHAEGQMQARAAVAGESAEKFDPLEFDRFTRFQELTRFMNESVHDVQTAQQAMLKNLDETSAAMSAQSKLNSLLQQSLMAIRMVPFSSISQRLYRIVRQTAKELDKKVNLELDGVDTELDRGVLEKMTAPFEHLLRNSIVHGLENPAQRELKGKPPVGNISLSLRQEGNEIVFVLKDDGAGLDIDKLREKGIEKGLLQRDVTVSDEQIMMLIFETGLSTASELSEISGRGVGMDVVLNDAKALGGRIEVASKSGQGATFTIYLPLTLSVMKALMVRAGNDKYAIPAVMVEQVQQVKPNDLIEYYRSGEVAWQDKRYPLHYLPRLLGDEDRSPESKPYNAILLLRSGEQRMALHLDELYGNKEVVVKNIGEQLARLSGIAGATVQSDGKVVLILNPVPLAHRLVQTSERLEQEATETVRKVPVVMIVDDSLTVRKITTKLLTRVGYEVVTAKDGVDALEQLDGVMPDVMLLDVEMPRMDGFELTKHMRRDEKTRELPIIMITSRTAEKHKNYAFELGVNEYLGKPYQDDELLSHIAKFAPLTEAAVND